jgi:hypothetical protein
VLASRNPLAVESLAVHTHVLSFLLKAYGALSPD